ncbi:MAG TPA: polysaccharide biosynthesis/export family protein [Burkholderiales bacterium]|nr:polysaccharide biosynthesis/export family protein [Burkholderiales bacterium]
MMTRATIFILTALFCVMLVGCAQPSRAPLASADMQKPVVTRAVAETDAPPPGMVEYRLGPGDVVKISVSNKPDLGIETEVAQDGKISFPPVGEIPLGGYTRVGAERAVSERLDSGGFVQQAHVNLLITQYRSR